jgi:ABC-type anion transport system duplicated permease subunit
MWSSNSHTVDARLCGIGSYIALAIQKQNPVAIGYAMLTMLLIIIAHDQLLFRPVVARTSGEVHRG